MNAQTLLAVVGLALFSRVSALPEKNTEYVHPSNGICTDYKINNTVSSLNLIYQYPKFRDNFDVAAHLFNVTQVYRQTPEEGAEGYMPFAPVPQNATATYQLAGTFCRPKKEKSGNEKTVLVATHGLGYDRRYWAPSHDPERYNFVQAMLESGYSVFYYDRLGTGQSQKISGYLNQQSIQVKLLQHLVADIRGGKWTDTVKAEKIAVVGHSFGSTISAAAVANTPDFVEGLILTGYAIPAMNDTLSSRLQTAIPSIFANRIATPTYPDRDSGYLMFGDIYAHIETFFHEADYLRATAEYAHSISQPAAAGEFLTITLAQSDVELSAAFKGKLWIGTGQRDLIVCSGNCDVPFRSGAYKEVYKGVQDPRGYVLEGAGHGPNLHLNAQDFFGDIKAFLDRGL
ncbi:Alpha/Beta hydrolase protein [Massariosphaeria phaeospora]|uniref:Alpha/Beta hydrolase protein n=1 Tax=Massariosphaeria phaeospora TaxID=100035 RepID=A0A7C8IB84_9PLEO|nr:Alpha/Beta hydrolase protein [Massariosphaeria phaeospora]